jgi:hypothetical protein
MSTQQSCRASTEALRLSTNIGTDFSISHCEMLKTVPARCQVPVMTCLFHNYAHVGHAYAYDHETLQGKQYFVL